MKTILSVLGFSFISIFAANAQTTYGLKAGMNFSKITERKFQNYTPSYFVTGFAEYPLTSRLSIQPGLSLQGKGSKTIAPGSIMDPDIKGDYKGTMNTMSIEIPINMIYYVPVGYGDIFLSAGPYIGYNISGKIKESNYEPGSTQERSSDIKFSGNNKYMNRIDAGVNFGLGYKLKNGLLFQAGYGLGLTDLNGIKNVSLPSSSYRTFNFGVGFQF